MIDDIEFNAEANDGYVRLEVSVGIFDKQVDVTPDKAHKFREQLDAWETAVREAAYTAERQETQTDLEGNTLK